MKSGRLLTVFLLGLFALAGCDKGTVPPSTNVQRHWVEVPALPIIQEAVFSLAPSFNGQRNPKLMEQVCGLASGELRQEQVNAFLAQQRVDPLQIPTQGSPLSLLVNGDKSSQTTACAAHLATTVLSAVDAADIITTTNASGTPALQIDNARLNQVLPVKIAEARANADVFALIAAELQRRPGLKVSDYRQQAKDMFVRLAPVYLERVKQQLPLANVTYKVSQIDAERFSFNTSTGASYEYAGDGLVLHQNGIVWYGRGKLLGREYPLQVAYFPESVGALLAPEAK